MSERLPAEVCYLFLIPLQANQPAGSGAAAIPAPKETPDFYELDLDIRAAGQRQLTLDGVEVQVNYQVLDGRVWLADCRFTLPDILPAAAVQHKCLLQGRLQESLRREAGYDGRLLEEFTVLLIRQIERSPEELLARCGTALARMLRSLEAPLSDDDVEEILQSRGRYSQADLVIVDWEGAVIIDAAQDFEGDIELLKIGNYQLLRYRLLDGAIEQSLRQLRQNVGRRFSSLWPLSPRKRTLQGIVERRLDLLLDFEKIDQSLLLIGDWYSAEIYRLIVDELYLDEWKAAVSNKLDHLAAIDEVIRQELAFSWGRLWNAAEIIGWFILLVGYFLLFFADLGWFN